MLLTYGTREQKAESFLASCPTSHVYCQGFSEPDYGSDLAGVRTTGVVDGDELVITGQKIWTTRGARANHMFMLVRTNPEADKHAGLTWVIIDFHAPGVDFRPIKQMSGSFEFGQCFFDEVRTPLAQRGWRPQQRVEGGNHDPGP